MILIKGMEDAYFALIVSFIIPKKSDLIIFNASWLKLKLNCIFNFKIENKLISIALVKNENKY